MTKAPISRVLLGAAAVSSLALTLAACGPGSQSGDTSPSAGTSGTTTPSSGAASVSGTLSGSGATSQQKAEEGWIAGFTEANSGAQITYNGTGSSTGREQFLSGAVQFAGSDSALSDEELAKVPAVCQQGAALELPVYVSPIAVVYNLPAVTDLQLSPTTLAKIFKGEITTWDDDAIKADNPGATLPSTSLVPVNRSDGSGTTKNFTDYLSKVAPDVWTDKPADEWPLTGTQSGNGTSGLIQTVKGAEGTIGYADLSAVGDLGTAKIGVGSAWVAPSADAAAKLLDVSEEGDGANDHRLSISLDRTTTEPGAYPVVLVSYLLGCEKYADENTAELVKAYFTYVASPEGQERANEAAGTAPISTTLAAKVQKAIDTIEAA